MCGFKLSEIYKRQIRFFPSLVYQNTYQLGKMDHFVHNMQFEIILVESHRPRDHLFQKSLYLGATCASFAGIKCTPNSIFHLVVPNALQCAVKNG